MTQLTHLWGFPDGSNGKESTCNAGDPCLIPGLGRSPREWNGNPLWYSCLENSMDRGGPWDCQESDMAQRLSMCACTLTHSYTNYHLWNRDTSNFSLLALLGRLNGILCENHLESSLACGKHAIFQLLLPEMTSFLPNPLLTNDKLYHHHTCLPCLFC